MAGKYNDSYINELSTFFLARDAWRDWTPTVTQGVAVAATVTAARYINLANTVILHALLDITGAGTIGNTIIVGGIPTAVSIASPVAIKTLGSGIILDVSAAFYAVTVCSNGATTLEFFGYNVGSRFGISPNMALANGDAISFTVTYEKA